MTQILQSYIRVLHCTVQQQKSKYITSSLGY